MSAIFGIISTSSQPVDPAWVERMRANLQHRGPDGQGLWQEGHVMLGHFLLRVTPESQYESSPLLLEHLVVAADARLDERTLLMDKLRIPQEQRPQTTDPELIGRAYLQWGDRAPEHLCGDFAFAIWDRRERRLFCARDHVGVKPFVYAHVNGLFAFSTEMRAVVDLPFLGKELSRKAQIEHMAGMLSDPAVTMWSDVNRIAPAHALTIANGTLSIGKYWDSQTAPKVRFARKEDYVQAFRELLTLAVEERLRTDYEVGSLLSGGLDSSAVSCIAADKLDERNRTLYACSAVLPENHSGQEIDERNFIEAVTRSRTNIETTYTDESGLSYSRHLFETFERQYQPVNAFHYLDQALAESLSHKPGLRRVLSGYFGDAVASNWSLLPLPCLLSSARFGAFFRYLEQRRQFTGKGVKKLIKNELIFPVLPARLLDSYKRLRKQPAILEMNWMAVQWRPGERKQIYQAMASYKHSLDKFNYKKSLWSGREDYFIEEFDILYAPEKLEAAYPLADKRILEFLLGIPPEILQYDGVTRGLFRKAIEGIVPAEVATRKSKGAFSPQYARILLAGYMDLKHHLDGNEVTLAKLEIVDLAKLKKNVSNLEISKESSIFAQELINVHNTLNILYFQSWLSLTKRYPSTRFNVTGSQ